MRLVDRTINLTGKRYGNLLVLEKLPPRFIESEKRLQGFHKCICICGAIKEIKTSRLKRSKSCGCTRSGTDAVMGKHGESAKRTAEHKAWKCMKQRCFYKGTNDFKNYGGRGITVCDRWRYNYSLFLKDMGRKPSPQHSLDRIDSNGNYEPSNCRWATPQEQANNKRNTVFIEYNGIKMTLSEYSNITSIRYGKAYQSIISYNKTPEEVFSRHYKTQIMI